MKLSVFPSSMETARSLIFHLVDIMNAEPDKTFNIAVSGGSTPALMFDLWANEYAEYYSLEAYETLLGRRTLRSSRRF